MTEWVIPEDIMEEYNLKHIIQSGCVLAEFKTCILGLPQAGRVAYIKLVRYLVDDCYFPTGHTRGLFVTSHDQQHSILSLTNLAPKWLEKTMLTI